MWNHFSSTESDGDKERYNRPGILECVEHESIDITPFCNWTKLNIKLKAHSVSPIHTKCALDMKSFKEAIINTQ